ncbi:MAG: response regulator [Chthoniobacterales bacterium]|nr:response regulator [Chthoniobacterales bacterium]
MNTTSTILLCEDNEIDAELTLNALAQFRENGQVDVARDGVEALDYLYRRKKYAGRAAETPVLVLLDVKMPRMDGLEVLRTIKKDPQLKNIPVVMLTSSRQEIDLVESYEGGANAYVVKPVDFEKFAEVVRETGQFWTRVNEPAPAASREV